MTLTGIRETLVLVGHQPGSISERELWACAYKVIDTFGADAELHAAMRADELLDEGDLDGQRVWKAILERIRSWRAEGQPSVLQ